MSNIPLSDDLQELFRDITNGTHIGDDAPRAILVQNENGFLKLVSTAPPQGTDKDDFTSVLSKLFSSEPCRPGYALYRLDSKSPAGLYEWLNCAYRPESAKVREKMQYTLTQTSLLKGLSEQHFLETVYGGAVGDFSFPRTLRNQRKHDYQNPQQQMKGKSAAEAAGTGTGGARRNFDAAALSSTKAAPSTSVSGEGAAIASTSPAASGFLSTSKGAETSAPTKEEESEVISEPEQRAEREAFARGQEETSKSKEAATQQQEKLFMPEPEEVIPSEASEPPPAPEVVSEAKLPSTVASKSVVESEAKKEGETEELANGNASEEDINTKEAIPEKTAGQPDEHTLQATTAAAAAAPAGLAAIASTAGTVSENQPEEAEKETEKEEATSIAPTNNDIPAPSVKAELAPASQAAPVRSTSSISRGTGTGAAGLETEREKHLAELKRSEEAERTGSNQGGASSGVKMGFSWHAAVEPAIRGLATKVSGTSEWNLVVLTVDLAKEEVQLRQEPRFVPPGDVAQALPPQEPLYAFYRHPDEPEATGGEGRVGFIYVCPEESSVRQRMLFSTNVIKLVKSVDTFQGLNVVKRLETSDPSELTPDVLLENFVKVDGDSATKEKPLERHGFSRPKKPGRR